MRNARNWELQALLKARPVGGDTNLSRSFMNMAREVILQKGDKIIKDDIVSMRSRIMNELTHKTEGIDIKLGRGGIEEIEFFVQFLQLHNARTFPEILVQNTLSAINRLAKKGLLDNSERVIFYDSYTYLRNLETFLRLNEEQLITEQSDVTELSAEFFKHRNCEEFLDHLITMRDNVSGVVNNI